MRGPGVLLATAFFSAALIAPTNAYADHGPPPNPSPVVVSDPPCAFDRTGCVATTHVVQRGEWLWKIARSRLAQASRSTAPANVRRLAALIYADNRRIIGPNSNRLRAGQRLSIRSPQDWPV